MAADRGPAVGVGTRRRAAFASVAIVVGIAAGAALAVATRSARADGELPVRDGLDLWLDAAGINAARAAGGQPALESGASLDAWPDASGHDRHLTQSEPASRPTLHAAEGGWFVRFDGDNDALRRAAEPAARESLTVFLVAAPHANPGDFRGLLATNAPDKRDYQSGLTIDLGPGPTLSFEQLNVEGIGFGGARNLRQGADPFGTLHTIEAVIDGASREVRLLMDGKPEGSRPFERSPLSLEPITIGARFYTNGPGEQIVRGFAAADIAEILVYGRVLNAAESDAVRGYLKSKYAKLAGVLPSLIPRERRLGIPLVKVEHPPDVRMLLPGFSVHELPVAVTNVNNVRFREDGKLVTLGYNGDVHLLSDTNGDGLEDRAEPFWKNAGTIRGPIGIVLTKAGDPRGRGLFVSSKGKVSLIVDTDGDDRADKEIVVASGWKEIAQNVDAVGLAMDAGGNLYFGLGTANYANAYLIDDQGKAAYDIGSERGTVQKVSADFSKRETVCTGIRFPIAFAFNDRGDLFCTEQEGATWLSNGNPFDELLHIRPGLHYGFPPRHPRHNPGVLDEPSTYDYGPQHQSTCGMVFNEGVHGGPVFGPASWRGDAIVCGESRGKIWRTRIVPSPSGYVADSQLIACLQMLTVDACVAPNGDLVVACHSGPPDWGTGPTGIGKVFRIRPDAGTVPRPIAAWAESDREVRIAFDGALAPEMLSGMGQRLRIEFGAYVRAGDRFENLMPPYAVVQRQRIAPRWELAVLGVSVTNDWRTMVIRTAPMAPGSHYAVTMLDWNRANAGDAVPSDAAIDVDFSLHGVAATWRPAEGTAEPAWSGRLPHPDMAVARRLLEGSAHHEPLWRALALPGTLTIEAQVDLRDIYRPAVQPGATIDYEWPKETATLRIAAGRPIVVRTGGTETTAEPATATGSIFEARIEAGETPNAVPVTVSIATGNGSDRFLSWSVSTNENAEPRPIAVRRFLPPWIDASPSAADPVPSGPPSVPPELAGGNWGRGRRVFRSEAAACSKCHAVTGDKATIGPSLKNLIHRDYASVWKDIVDPSFAINPDHVGYVCVLRDGRTLTGVARTDGDDLLLGDEKGATTRIRKGDVETIRPATASVMPKGLHEQLTPDQVRDLMTYLLTPAPSMPLDAPLDAPPIRTPEEVEAALAGAVEPATPPRPLRVVLVDGVKDHGPGEHDYPAWRRAWQQWLSADPTLTVSEARDTPDDPSWEAADIIIFFQKGAFDAKRSERLDRFLARGGGAVYIHWAVNGDERAREFARRIGLASRGGNIKYRHGPLTLDFHNTDHPIVRNFSRLSLYDESYWLLSGDPGKITLLATSAEDGEATPQLWATDHGNGRVFVSIPGHFNWTFDDPLFRILLLRGIAWTAKEPVDRFNDLVPLGARMSW
ncbi:MAG: c-type cytochrome [Planctomycetes bacterium]|nr:c-type cytochrome [Planctomycetota bacterium]